MSGWLINDYDKSNDDYDKSDDDDDLDEGVCFHPFHQKWVAYNDTDDHNYDDYSFLSSSDKILYQMQDSGCLHLPRCAIMFLTVCVCVSVKRLSGEWVGGWGGNKGGSWCCAAIYNPTIARV